MPLVDIDESHHRNKPGISDVRSTQPQAVNIPGASLPRADDSFRPQTYEDERISQERRFNEIIDNATETLISIKEAREPLSTTEIAERTSFYRYMIMLFILSS
eukprot:TRINITY_DN9939_c0_g1_i6.p1 TRINITY_DN9939_c0_g1~~TRINITY_DN9939_c0_g1_i6.p1  ORF type:complete len:103 (+),score=13.45 TRINITY_DN9939_c0_g1_i6:71-379(+)